MRIQRVEAALSECETHLSSSPPEAHEIRLLLIQALLILIHAELEQVIVRQVKRRCAGARDAAAAKFVNDASGRMVRSLRITELAGLLGHFDAEYKRRFQSEIGQEVRNKYHSLIEDRNAAAHGGGTAPSMADVREYYRYAQLVLDRFLDALFHGTEFSVEANDSGK